MAREINEIQQEIINEVNKNIPNLNSSSKFSIWRLWTYITASSIHLFEKIIDRDKNAIEDNLSRSRYGQLSWYVKLAYDFKLGYKLRVTDAGALEYIKYEDFDSSVDIEPIKRVSVIEADDGQLIIKIATKDNKDNLIQLSNELKLQFENYIEAVKIAGTQISVISLPADKILIDSDIYFNPIYSIDTIKGNLRASLYNYKRAFSFSGKLFKNDILEVIRNTEGINDVILKKLTGKQGDNITEVIRVYEVQSGYFNFYPGDASALDFIETQNYIPNEMD